MRKSNSVCSYVVLLATPTSVQRRDLLYNSLSHHTVEWQPAHSAVFGHVTADNMAGTEIARCKRPQVVAIVTL